MPSRRYTVFILACSAALFCAAVVIYSFARVYAVAPNPGHTWTEIGDVAVTVAQGGTGTNTLTANNLVVGNGTSAVSFIAPGTTGQVLASNGTAWVAASNEEDISAYRRSNGAGAPSIWYTSPVTGTALTTGAPTANVLRAIPFVVTDTTTFDMIAINVTTLLTGNARMGIYRDNGNVYPGTLVLDAGAVSTATTGAKTIAISQSLTGGLYWLVLVESAAPTLRCFAVASMVPMLGFDATLPTTPGLFYTVAFTYAALPASFPAGATVGTAVPIPAIFMRKL